MQEFAYRAITAEGRTVSGRQSASDESDLEARLGRLQLELLSAKEVRTSTFFTRKKIFFFELLL